MEVISEDPRFLTMFENVTLPYRRNRNKMRYKSKCATCKIITECLKNTTVKGLFVQIADGKQQWYMTLDNDMYVVLQTLIKHRFESSNRFTMGITKLIETPSEYRLETSDDQH